jgi:hypothetical protein
VSQAIGVVILIGIVFVGALMVSTMGAAILTDLEGEVNRESAGVMIQNVDRQLSSLSDLRGVSRVEFDLGALRNGNSRVVRSGHLNLTVNTNSTCRTSIPLSSVRFESRNNWTYAYEAGGVWRQNTGGRSTMVSEPDVRRQNRSTTVTVVNVTGSVLSADNTAIVDVNASHNESQNRTAALFTGNCVRPDNVTLVVQSDFYRAWGRYLDSEMNVNVERFNANESVKVFLPQDRLPKITDDERNDVINLSGAPYMDSVSATNHSLMVDKGNGNRYRAVFQSINFPLDVGKIQKIDDTVTVNREPIDLAFIVDHSGSMRAGQGFSPPDCDPPDQAQCQDDKLVNATAAAKLFVGELNQTKDRAGTIGFNQSGYLYLTDDGHRFSDNYGSTGINSSLDRIANRHQGGTHIDTGIKKARELYDHQSPQTHKRIALLLADGKNQGSGRNDLTEREAEKAAEKGITIYTIGYGQPSEINQTLLQEVADRTGGESYLAEDADQLDVIFDDIAQKIVETQNIARTPLSTNVTSEDGTEYPPEILGNSAEIATDATRTPSYVNVNDPYIGGNFSHSFPVRDGEKLILNASVYKTCEQWNGTEYIFSLGNDVYEIARCTDLDESSRMQLPDDNKSVFLKGEDVSHLLTNESGWWQQNMTDRLEPYMDSDENLTIESNEALYVFRFDSSPDNDNRLLLLGEIGQSEEAIRPEDVINVRVRNVTVKTGG